MISKNILSAIDLASRLHKNHTRRDAAETPYVSHLFSVAMFLKEVTDDESVIIAGLMHDALEDVPDYEYEDLVSDCGEEVAVLVRGVTENKTLPYKERKIDYLNNLKNGNINCVIISMADKLHNAMSLSSVDEKHNMNFDTQKLIYNEVLKIGKDKFKEEGISEGDKRYNLIFELEKVLNNI